MPQLDFITYWIFSPIYYILLEWHVFVFIFVSLASFFFFSYKFYSKEINLMGLGLIQICIFIYKKFLSIWFSIEFFFFTQTSFVKSNAFILPANSEQQGKFLPFVSRGFDYWIVAIQGGFGFIIKWISLLVPGIGIVWVFSCILSPLFGMTFEIQVMYCFFAFISGLSCFRFGLWEPGFIWNLYDPFNQKPWINDWEDIDVVEMRPWHLTTFHGSYIILFTWLGLKIWDALYLSPFYCQKPNLLFNQDLVEFGFDVKLEVFSRSYVRQPLRIPIPRKWEVITEYTLATEKHRWWLDYKKQHYKKQKKELASGKIWKRDHPSREKFNSWWRYKYNKYTRRVWWGKAKHMEPITRTPYTVVPLTKLRQNFYKFMDRKAMNAAFKRDPVFLETRKRHKFYKIKRMDMELSSKVLSTTRPYSVEFLDYLSYPHLWSNRLINFSFYFSDLYDRRSPYQGKPARLSGNKWYISGYLIDIYQKQLIDLKKLYRLYLTYSEIIYNLEKRSITIPEFRVLVEFSVKPLNSPRFYPYWNDIRVSYNLLKTRLNNWNLITKDEIKRSSPEYSKKWNYLYPKFHKKVKYLTHKLKKDQNLFREERSMSFKVFVEEVQDYFKQHPNMTKKQRKKFKKDQFKEFSMFWSNAYYGLLRDMSKDFKNILILKQKIAYLQKYRPISKNMEIPQVYLNSLHSKFKKSYKFHDPLSLDLDLRFIEWHPIIGPLNKEDFLSQSDIKERILRPGWKFNLGPTINHLKTIAPKPYFTFSLTNPPTIYNSNISFAAQKTYEYWFSLYKHLIVNDNNLKIFKKFPKKLNNEIFTLSFKNSLIQQDLSTKQLLQSLVDSGVLKDFLVETKVLDKSVENYEVKLPTNDWFFNLNPRLKVDYPWMGQGSKVKFTNKKSDILWYQPRKQALFGAKVFRNFPEVKMPTYGGIPNSVLYQRMRRRLQMDKDIHYFDLILDWLIGDYVKRFWNFFYPGWFNNFIHVTKNFILYNETPIYKYTLLQNKERILLKQMFINIQKTKKNENIEVFNVFFDLLFSNKKPRKGSYWEYLSKKYSLKLQTFIMNTCVNFQYIRYFYRSIFITLDVKSEILNFKKDWFSHPFYFLSNRERKIINNYIIKTGSWDILDLEKRKQIINNLIVQQKRNASKKKK